MLKLFIVYLGGEVRGCHVEMHDVRFVVGETIEDTYPQLRTEWIGTPESLHIDAYLVLNYADGYEVRIEKTPGDFDRQLYFVNTGAYDSDHFTELHEIGFYVASSPQEAKQRALDALLTGKMQKHKDNLFDIDNCLSLSEVNGFHIHLIPTDKIQSIKPDWFGYNTEVRSK